MDVLIISEKKMAGLASDKSIELLLKEMKLDVSLYSGVADKKKAAGFILGMCFVRFDPRFREQLRSQLKVYAFCATLKNIGFTNQAREMQSYQRLAMSLLFVMDKIIIDPESYPFALSEVEFATYATQIFGGEIQNIQSTYHAPSYYIDAAKLAAIAVVGLASGAAATIVIPETLAASAVMSRLAPAIAKSVASGVGGKIAEAALPVNLRKDYQQKTLWTIYNLDLERRKLK
ncbi:hypothetical protein [Acetobacter thailandicus]|uniref:hypothetical protein n=1 Tax=Acetobacter thailandicus TaxID=1502842 RepID=UPI001BAB74C8|nr:hypothetical protein [Acetobacter thailandicus]MBS0960972.1 hypothetical protein [Acetobacter thailandicus]